MPEHRRTGAGAVLRPTRRCGRPCAPPRAGEPIAAGIHNRPRTPGGVLAISPHPQTGQAQRADADGTRRWDRRAGDHRRHPRTLPVRRPTGGQREAGAPVRRLRGDRRRADCGRCGTEVPRRPGVQSHRRDPAFRPGTACGSAPRGRGRQRPVLADIQTRPHPPGGSRRRTGRAAGGVAASADPVLRNPPARRRVHLPVPRRSTRLGQRRTARRRPCGDCARTPIY